MTSDSENRLREDFSSRLEQHSDITDHLQFMHDTVLAYPHAVVIELGVRSGNSTSALLSAVTAQKGRRRGSVWSADLQPPQVPEYWHGIPLWHFMQGDSVSPEVLAWMPHHADVVFMDTSHVFDQQLAELRAYVPRVRPGGKVLVHDTQCIPADDFRSDSFTAMPGTEGPVTDALDAYCEETGLSWQNRHSELPYYGMGVITIPGGGNE